MMMLEVPTERAPVKADLRWSAAAMSKVSFFYSSGGERADGVQTM